MSGAQPEIPVMQTPEFAQAAALARAFVAGLRQHHPPGFVTAVLTLVALEQMDAMPAGIATCIAAGVRASWQRGLSLRLAAEHPGGHA